MLSPDVIKKFIDNDASSEKKKLAKIGQRYYDGHHDIEDYTMYYLNDDGKLVKDTLRTNMKIAHPFFTEISDQFTGYLLSDDENPVQAKQNKDGAHELQERLDEYFNHKFWDEFSGLISGSYNKGWEFMYCFKNEDNRTVFECSDSLGVVEIDAKESPDGKAYTIFSYIEKVDLDGKPVAKVQVWDDTYMYLYTRENGNGALILDTEAEINPRPHILKTNSKTGQTKGKGLGYIPFFRLDYNKKQVSGVMPIKGLIDDYDIHACALSNNLQDFDTPIFVAKGYPGDELDRIYRNIRTKKTVAPDETGDLDVKTVDIPYQARKEMLDINEKGIYKYGFAVNTAGLKDTNATTNLAIEQAYSLLDIKAKKMIKRLNRFLENILEKVVLPEINEEYKTAYKLSDIEIKFKPNININETEVAQLEKTKAETKQIEINTIQSAASTLDDETVVKAICDVLDLDYEEVKSKLPKSPEGELATAQTILDGAVVE